MSTSVTNRRIVNTPLKIILDEDTQYYLQKNRIKFSSIRLADGRTFQGITINKYHLSFLQSFVINGSLLSAEMRLSDIIACRDDIIDLVKGLTYAALYRRFATESLSLLKRLGVLPEWNRTYPKMPMTVQYSSPLIYQLVEKYSERVHEMREAFLRRIQHMIQSSKAFNREDYKNLILTTRRFIHAAGPRFLALAFLAQFAQRSEIQLALANLTIQFLKKTLIPDYLSMLAIELSMYVSGLVKPTSSLPLLGMSNEQVDSETIIIWNFNQKRSDVENERVKMLVSISNKYSEFHNLQSQIAETSKEMSQYFSIQEYYLAKGSDPTKEETLGLSYLSFVSRACQEQGIYFESFVSTIQKLEQTLFSVSLHI